MDPVLDVDSLRKTYGDTVAVDALSLRVEAGAIFGLIGPNGAGKTTAVECMTGLRTPDAGRVRLLGLDPQRESRALRQRLGMQLQESALPARLTVIEAARLFASFYASAADPDTLIETWGLADRRDTAYADLSGGQKQRLALALALIHDPDVVVLDELSAGLDPQARLEAQRLVRRIRDAGTTVLLVTHFMDEAEALCDRVALMDQGRLVALDTPRALTDRLDADVRVRFTAPEAFDADTLGALDGVTRVRQSGTQVTVYGRDPLLGPVSDALAAQDLAPTDLRAEPTSLEDVFLAATDQPMAAAAA
jgi:ABC-2 type transport system ATP-binding protein